MLVLQVKIDEWIHIGPDIRVQLVEVGHLKVKLGVEAPRDVDVDRGKVWLSKRRGERP